MRQKLVTAMQSGTIEACTFVYEYGNQVVEISRLGINNGHERKAWPLFMRFLSNQLYDKVGW